MSRCVILVLSGLALGLTARWLLAGVLYGLLRLVYTEETVP